MVRSEWLRGKGFGMIPRSTGDGWASGGAAGNFVKEQVIPIPVPGAVAGHVFHYEGRLVSDDNQVISFGESNRFILV
jgi:hypothetical protein